MLFCAPLHLSLPSRQSVCVDLVPEDQSDREQEEEKHCPETSLQNTALPGKKEKEEIVWTCVGVCEGATAPRKSRGAEEVLLYLQLLKSLPAIGKDSARTSDNSEPQQACSARVKNSAQTFASVWVELGKLAV